jgi:predicted Zn-dependent protease with MMP-like domain
VPLARSRAERFDALVLDAVERLEKRWEQELRGVEFAVEEVPAPPPGRPGEDGVRVPLGRAFPRTAELPARVVIYRRPIETRAPQRKELAALVHDVVVEQVADLLGVEPETVDPRYEGPE